MNKELKNLRKLWYSNLAVRYELVKSMRDREVILMDRKDNRKCIRYLCVRSVQFLDYIFDKFNFYDRDYNIYISVAKYKNIPQFTFKLQERSQETREWVKKDSLNEIFEYDILLDFDCHKDVTEFPKMKDSISYFAGVLKREGICFQMYPSGSGFQIVIKGEDYKSRYPVKRDYLSEKCKNGEIREIVKLIRSRFSLKHLDMKVVGTFNGIRKCPYSLARDRVVLPLGGVNLDSFIYTDYKVKGVLKDYVIKNRRKKYFNEPNQNVNKFEDKYLFWLDEK